MPEPRGALGNAEPPHLAGGGSPGRSVPRRLRVLAVAAAAMLPIAAGYLATPAASAAAGELAGVSHVMLRSDQPVTVFPPKANSVWAYDTSSPGTWVDAIRDYNQRAAPGHELTGVFSYATDLEMYCPGNDGTRCTANDLYSFYTPGSRGRASTEAYHEAFDATDPGPLVISPIIDGLISPAGYLQGFNELRPGLAAGFADEVAGQVCADRHADGIQFDIEPFNVSTKNGQYYFYQQIARDFAGYRAGDPAQDPYGCVDAAHPHGRFFSVFTGAASIEPGTGSAANVQRLVNSYGNGYVIDSLYDLSGAPAGTLDGLATYRPRVRREAADMKRWADRLRIKYMYGIPASASVHEFTTCTAAPGATGSCLTDAAGAAGYPMIDYTRAAVHAIELAGAAADPQYLGAAIWDFGDHVSSDGLSFGPVPAPADALAYLATSLPGAGSPVGTRQPGR